MISGIICCCLTSFRIVVWPSRNAVQPADQPVELDAAIAGRERSNGEIPPGGMRCFLFMPPEGYWKGDTKSRATPYGATPGSCTTVASCTTWYNLARSAISASPATRRVRVCVCGLARTRVRRDRSRLVMSFDHVIVLLSLRAIYKKYLLESYSEFILDETLFVAVKNTPIEIITFFHVF